jgi:hypothetical protein
LSAKRDIRLSSVASGGYRQRRIWAFGPPTAFTQGATMKKTETVSKERTGHDDWRGEVLAQVRALIKAADPDVVEVVKWRKPSNAMRGVPVWEHDGIICTGETYKDKVKLTFARGAALKDSSGLFNSSLEGGTRRAIDFHEGSKINEKAFKALIRAAVALNTSRTAGRRPTKRPAKR